MSELATFHPSLEFLSIKISCFAIILIRISTVHKINKILKHIQKQGKLNYKITESDLICSSNFSKLGFCFFSIFNILIRVPL